MAGMKVWAAWEITSPNTAKKPNTVRITWLAALGMAPKLEE